ncbi:hypothetical protein [Falsiroseomonas stagni]|uniref:Uncharacterized protein n=1 Tax=Falsiroseomonas stagni DSM 19981 TaxID=1123062 RepID=A0A1I4F7M6_9PROT|nr:hypothetical protein [Falsiroseomonas stagni]SFL13904.1 hypothetical protein SAMN02745775_12512 [Falsiroseomonas stagni DSM 19981]
MTGKLSLAPAVRSGFVLIFIVLTLFGCVPPPRQPTSEEVQAAIDKYRSEILIQISDDPQWFKNLMEFKWQIEYNSQVTEQINGRIVQKPIISVWKINQTAIVPMVILSVIIMFVGMKQGCLVFFVGPAILNMAVFAVGLVAVGVRAIFSSSGLAVSWEFVWFLGFASIIILVPSALLIAASAGSVGAVVGRGISIMGRLRSNIDVAAQRRAAVARQQAAEAAHKQGQLRDMVASLASFAELLGHSPDEDRQILVRILEILNSMQEAKREGPLSEDLRSDVQLVLGKIESSGHKNSIAYNKLSFLRDAL